ncbi:hypothetical protein L665_01854 [Ralstonia solanacearum SD54]|nr:hypothetical protein L665_01854 [Ralstonia solanacearum SD54]
MRHIQPRSGPSARTGPCGSRPARASPHLRRQRRPRLPAPRAGPRCSCRAPRG